MQSRQARLRAGSAAGGGRYPGRASGDGLVPAASRGDRRPGRLPPERTPRPRPQQPARECPGRVHRVVVVGGGFGGLQAVRLLRNAEVEVTLVDRRNYHLFQPLLYQVATGALSPEEIAQPLRGILAR